MMHVEIKNSDFIHTVLLLSIPSSDTSIVQETEPTRFVPLSVMARWTHTAKCRAGEGKKISVQGLTTVTDYNGRQ